MDDLERRQIEALEMIAVALDRLEKNLRKSFIIKPVETPVIAKDEGYIIADLGNFSWRELQLMQEVDGEIKELTAKLTINGEPDG